VYLYLYTVTSVTVMYMQCICIYIHYGDAGSRTRLDRRLHTPSALAFCIHIYYGDAFCIYISVMPFVYITVTLVVVHDLVVAWTRRVRIHAHGLQVYL
jgi:hypothetical protein